MYIIQLLNKAKRFAKIWCSNLGLESILITLTLLWRPYRITDRYCFETFVNCPAVSDVPEPPCWWSLANFCKERKADNDSLTNFLMTGEYKLKNQRFGVPFTNSFWPKFKISISKCQKNLVSKVTWCKDGAMPDATAELESLGDEKTARALPTPHAEPILARPLPMAPDWMENWRSASPILQN